MSLPTIEPGEVLNQAAPGVYERTDTHGDKTRVTYGAINDQCTDYLLDALSLVETLHKATTQVNADSTEIIGGTKRIEALGALKLLSGGTLNIASADNLNQTTASDINSIAGRNIKERVAQMRESIAGTKQRTVVKNGGQIWLGDEDSNALDILSDLIQVVADIAATAASHQHPNVGPPVQVAIFSAQKISAKQLNTILKCSSSDLI